MDPRVLVASQKARSQKLLGNTAFFFVWPFSLCGASGISYFEGLKEAESFFEGPREAPWGGGGVPQDSGKMARFPVNFK